MLIGGVSYCAWLRDGAECDSERGCDIVRGAIWCGAVVPCSRTDWPTSLRAAMLSPSCTIRVRVRGGAMLSVYCADCVLCAGHQQGCFGL